MPTIQAKLQKGDRILIVCDTTDGKLPREKDPKSHVQGVDRTVMNMVKTLKDMGFKVKLIHPFMPWFLRFKLPLYPEIELALNPFGQVKRMLLSFKPNAIFNTVPEGPMGMYTSYICEHLPLEKSTPPLPYTVQYHTNLDEYGSLYLNRITGGALNLGPEWFRPLISYVYQNASTVLVPTRMMEKKLHEMNIGIGKTKLWPRGVDTTLFRPPQAGEENPYLRYTWYQKNPFPVLLNYGRIAEEKNIEKILKEKPRSFKYHIVFIGEGPYKKTLQEKYADRKDVHFLDKMVGDELASHVRFAGLHFFTSLTDTFGNTVIEAGASGVPTIAYYAPGPDETINEGVNGILLKPGSAILKHVDRVLAFDRLTCASYIAKTFSLERSAKILLSSLKRIDWP